MTRHQCPDNIPTAQVVEYYRRRAAGGAGLIITEGTFIDHPAAEGSLHIPFFHGDKALAGWRRVVEAVHAEGGKIFPQLWHTGAMRDNSKVLNPEVPPCSPSGLVGPGQVVGVAMTQQEMRDICASYARAAVAALEVGCDGVEIHGAHGYLIDNFLWSGSNQRTDEYGGSAQNRARFGTDVVRAVRAAVGPEVVISLRISQWKQADYDARIAQTSEELAQLLRPLAEAGVDIFHCSSRRFWEAEFPGSDLNLAGWAKRLTGLPAITVGSVALDAGTATLAQAAEALRQGDWDLLALGRALIANPALPSQLIAGEALAPFDMTMLKSLI